MARLGAKRQGKMIDHCISVLLTRGPYQCMIISQWTSVLELCSAYLSENAFDHLRYGFPLPTHTWCNDISCPGSFIGKMSLRQRDDAVNRFKNERDIKVLLSMFPCRHAVLVLISLLSEYEGGGSWIEFDCSKPRDSS